MRVCVVQKNSVYIKYMYMDVFFVVTLYNPLFSTRTQVYIMIIFLISIIWMVHLPLICCYDAISIHFLGQFMFFFTMRSSNIDTYHILVEKKSNLHHGNLYWFNIPCLHNNTNKTHFVKKYFVFRLRKSNYGYKIR